MGWRIYALPNWLTIRPTWVQNIILSTHRLESCVHSFYCKGNMTFTSKLDWDTNINAVGGQSNVLLVDSPYSDLPSANASQGALTYGNLTTEFAPPKIEISAIDNGYYIHSRMHTGEKNPAVDIVSGGADTPAKAEAAAAKAEAGEEAPAAPKAEAGQGKEGFKECMRQKTYVAPSRRGVKPTLNVARDNITKEGGQESYTEMPEFVGSNIHQKESFSFETYGKWMFSFMIILIALLVTYGVLRLINRANPNLLPQWLKNLLKLENKSSAGYSQVPPQV